MVSFAVSPQVRRLSLHDADSLSVEDLHWKLKFSATGRLPGGETRFVDFLRGLVRGMTYLPPGATTTVPAELGPGAVSGVNVQTQADSCSHGGSGAAGHRADTGSHRL